MIKPKEMLQEHKVSIFDLAFPSCICNNDLDVIMANEHFEKKINVRNLKEFITHIDKFEAWIEKIKNENGVDSNYFLNNSGQNALIYCSCYKNNTYMFNFVKISDTVTAKFKDLHDAFIFDKIMTLEKIQELRNEIQLKNKLITLITHDIKNQLGIFQLIDDDMYKEILSKCSELTAKKFDLIYQVSDAFVCYINDLLNWIKASNRNVHINYEKIDLYELILKIVEINKYHTQRKQLTVLFSSLSRAIITSDITILTTILVNILNNAIKFSKPGNNIYITLLDLTDSVEIAIQDKGVGIPHEQLKHIFDTSHIQTTPGTLGEKGTGFGLILVKEFLTLINGKISIESKQNLGTKVKILLPKTLEET